MDEDMSRGHVQGTAIPETVGRAAAVTKLGPFVRVHQQLRNLVKNASACS